MKICSKCKRNEEETSFHKGLGGYCKDCKNLYDKIYRQSDKIQNLYNSEKYKENKNSYQKIRLINDSRILMLRSAKLRAKRLNLPFNIELEDIIIPDYCPLLQIKLYRKPVELKGSFIMNSPSLDKIIPELGYIKGNIMVISMKANAMKYNATIEELKLFAKNIQKLY